MRHGKHRTATSEVTLYDPGKSNQLIPGLRPTAQSDEIPAYFHTMKISTYLNALLAGLCIVLAFAENEYTAWSDYQETWFADCVRGLVLFLCLAQILLVHLFYVYLLKTRVARGLVHTESTSYTASLVGDKSLFPFLLLEVLLTCICMPPIVGYETYNIQEPTAGHTMTVGDILLGLTCLRAYQIIKVLYWQMRQAHDFFYLCASLSELEKLSSPLSYRIKRFLYDRPIQTIVLVYLSDICVLGLLLRTYERSVPGTALNSLYDGIWTIAVTQTTVGYGDVIPYTTLGRFACVCAALIGFSTSSIVCSSALRHLKMSVKELQFMDAVTQKMNMKETMAVGVLQHWWRLVSARKHDVFPRFNLLLSYMDCIGSFQRYMKRFRTKNYEEIDESLNNTRMKVSQCFLEHIKRLKDLQAYNKSLARLSTQQADMTSKLLCIKRASIRESSILLNLRRPRKFRPSRHRNTVITSLQKKQASDLAFRRMLEHRSKRRNTEITTEKRMSAPPVSLPPGDVTPSTEAAAV